MRHDEQIQTHNYIVCCTGGGFAGTTPFTLFTILAALPPPLICFITLAFLPCCSTVLAVVPGVSWNAINNDRYQLH